jgi:hypothetical protein
MDAKRSGFIIDIRIGRITCLTHLLFVDVILLFTYGYVREARQVQDILGVYNITI